MQESWDTVVTVRLCLLNDVSVAYLVNFMNGRSFMSLRRISTLFFSPSARGPDEVIARYWKVFKGYKSFPLVPSAKFAEFKDQHTTKHKLCDFAGKCRDAIRDIDDNVRELKKSGILLLVEKGDF